MSIGSQYGRFLWMLGIIIIIIVNIIIIIIVFFLITIDTNPIDCTKILYFPRLLMRTLGENNINNILVCIFVVTVVQDSTRIVVVVAVVVIVSEC